MQIAIPFELVLIPLLLAVIAVAIFLAIWVVTLNNVPLYEAHILTSASGKVRVFDGNGRYHFFPHFQKRIVMPKTIMEIKTQRDFFQILQIFYQKKKDRYPDSTNL